MKRIIKQIGCIFSLLFLPTSLFAWQWVDLWRTADQQGTQLLQAGKAKQAAQVFKNQAWQGVAWYRAEDYAQALARFKSQNTSDGQYNAGNAAAHLGHYQEAIDAYDKAIALNPNNQDAITNREIVKKLLNKKNEQSNRACSKNSSSSNNSSNSNNRACSKDSSSSSAKKGNNDEKKSANDQSTQQNQTQDNSSHNNDKETKTGQNDLQKNSGQHNEPEQADSSKTSAAHGEQLEPKNNDKLLNAKPDKQEAKTPSQWQAQEDQKQLLRRVSEDPGGLLRQKFLRDYLRRHSNGNDLNEGES